MAENRGLDSRTRRELCAHTATLDKSGTYLTLAYPELAAADAFKVTQLCETARGKTDEHGSRAVEHLHDTLRTACTRSIWLFVPLIRCSFRNPPQQDEEMMLSLLF